jgi:hypothetical protein
MHNQKEVFDKLVAPLHLQLALSGRFYQKYLEEKIFNRAEDLRACNKKIVQLVLENFDLIPPEIKEDVMELINHYEHWFTQYKLHQKKVRPGASDRFVFKPASDHFPFPTNAELHINLFYTDLKKQLTAEMLQE